MQTNTILSLQDYNTNWSITIASKGRQELCGNLKHCATLHGQKYHQADCHAFLPPLMQTFA
jgi:hypothetical protein